jgi:hypothetical protein
MLIPTLTPDTRHMHGIPNHHVIPNKEDLHRPETEYFGIMSDSSDDICAFGGQVAPLHRARHSFADGHDPYHILSEDSVEQLILDNILDGSDYDSDEPIDLEYVACLRRMRLRRCNDTFEYPGDNMLCIEGEHPTQAMNWNYLAVHERERRLLTEFRMYKLNFNELLGMVSPKLEESQSRNLNMRKYSNKAKLLITLSFLAHCPTLRQMASKWGCPHNSIAVVCLHPTTQALREVFLGDPPSRNIRFPSSPERVEAVVAGFRWCLARVTNVNVGRECHSIMYSAH